MVCHLLVDGHEPLVLPGLEGGSEFDGSGAAVGGEGGDDPPSAGRCLGAESRHHCDGELQTLRAVDGHDPHRVVVGLGKHGLADPRPVGRLELRPLEELAEAPTLTVAVRPRLVEDEANTPPHVTWSASGDAVLEHSSLTHQILEKLRGSRPHAALVERVEVGERLADGIAVGEAFRQWELVAPAAAVHVTESVEVVVAASEHG